MNLLRNGCICFLLLFFGNKILAQCPKNIGDTIVYAGIHSNIGAWYPLNGNAKDSSGFGNDGTVYNAYPAPDRFGNANMAYQFNGGGNYISIPGNTNHEPKDSMTVSAWIYMDDSTSVWHFFVTKRINRNVNPGNSYALYGGSPNLSQYLCYTNGNRTNETGIDMKKNVYTKNWYMLTGTYNRTLAGDYRGFLYVNGKLIDSFKQSGELYYIHSNPLFIGQAYDNSSNPPIHAQGRIDDVRVYKKDLCKQEIKYLYGDHLILDVKTKTQNSCLSIGDSTLVYIINPEPGIKYSLCDSKDSSLVKGQFYSKCDDTLKFFALNKYAGISYVIKAENSDGSCVVFLDKTIGFSSINSDFSISNTNPCQNEKVQFAVKSPQVNNTYFWKINNDTNSGNAANYSPQNFGIFKAKLITTNSLNGNTCKDSIEKSINVKEKPKVNFSINQAVQCFRKNEFFFTNTTIFSDTNALTYTWKSGYNIATSNYKNFNYSYGASGIFRVVLIALASNNCIDSAENFVTVKPSPDVIFTVNKTSQCLDSQNFVVKTNPSTDNKTWTWSDGTVFNNVDSCSHKFSTIGNYSVKLFAISANNCSDSSERNLEVNPIPIVDFTVNPVCFGEFSEFINTSKIDVGNISKYEWKIENNFYTTKDVSHIFSKAGNFDIELTAHSDKGCKAVLRKDTVAKVFPKPIAMFSLFTKEDDILGLVAKFTNKSQNETKLIWNLSTGETETLDSFIKIYVVDTLTLGVRLITINDDGCADTAYNTIFIESYSEIFIPNAFTPNSDEHNPVFKPLGIYKTLKYDFQIYNRWGELVFQTDDFTKGWDGTFRGKKSESGIYIYQIHVKRLDKKQQNFKGNLLLLN